MISELFRLGPISISPFGPAMVAAFLLAWAQVRWGLRQVDLFDEEHASALLLAAGIGGIVGAKLYYTALYGEWGLFFSRSGLVWYGGLVGGTLAVLWTARKRGLPMLPVADIGTAAVAAGYAVGRVGCFLVGDDFGIATRRPWGVAFPYGLPFPTTAENMRPFGGSIDPSAAGQDLVPVHPTQLYETFAALAILLLCRRLLRRRVAPGLTAAAGLGLLAVERFFVEFLRAKDDRFFGPLSLAQLLSVAIVVVLAVAVYRLRPSEQGGDVPDGRRGGGGTRL